MISFIPLQLRVMYTSLDPAPVSPHTVHSAAWRLLSGTTKGVYRTRPGAKLNELEAAKDIHFAPIIAIGVSVHVRIE
jgi:Gly-Xaa carboxypeptidase